MSEEARIAHLREKLGYEAKRKGESKHAGASKEFLSGFGSNVTPRKFGVGVPGPEWECVCGHINTSNRKRKRGNEYLCWNCGQPQSYVDIERISNDG